MKKLPKQYTLFNGGQQCDMFEGPCSCGAYHKGDEQREKIAVALGWTDLHFHEGRLWGIIPDAEMLDSQGALEKYFEVPKFYE